MLGGYLLGKDAVQDRRRLASCNPRVGTAQLLFTRLERQLCLDALPSQVAGSHVIARAILLLTQPESDIRQR